MRIADFSFHNLRGGFARRWVLPSVAVAFALSAHARPVPFGPENGVTVAGSFPFASCVFDQDNDGDLDIAVASVSFGVTWYENDNGDGSAFTAHPVHASGIAFGLHAADLNNDGYQDLISTQPTATGFVYYYENDQIGGFESPVTVTSGNVNGAISCFAADLDADGYLDVISASQNSPNDKIAWYKNNGDDTFGSQQVIASGGSLMRSVTAADLDGDGDQDVIAAANPTVVWYANNGAGIFSGPNTVDAAMTGALSIKARDIDGDGRLDVIYGSDQVNIVRWARNTGGGSFAAPITISSTVATPRNIDIADLDEDGDLDVLSASLDGNRISWHENTDGAGSFASPVLLGSTGNDTYAVNAGDIDGDGDFDAVSVNGADNDIVWYANTTIHRSSAFPDEYPLGFSQDHPRDILAVDIDRDGDMDMVACSSDDNGVFVYLNAGGGFFDTQYAVAIDASEPRSVATADFDGDGDPDLASASFLNDTIAWYPNTDGAGSFLVTKTIDTGLDGAVRVAVGDLNGDGKMDVIAAGDGATTDEVSWYPNVGGTDPLLADNKQILVSTAFAFQPSDLAIADINGDGRLDILVAGAAENAITWHPNLSGGPFGASFPARLNVNTLATGASSVDAADMDGDGDMDVIGAAAGNDTIAWFENTDGAGTFGSIHLVANAVVGVSDADAVDMDGDGDMDIVFSTEGDFRVGWYENEDGVGGTGFAKPIITKTFAVPAVLAADLDGDGDLDVASVFGDDSDSDVGTYENRGGQFALETANTAPASIDQGELDDMLRITVVNRGGTGDTDVEIASFELLFEQADGDPLTSAEANAIISDLHIYKDDGNGVFDPGLDNPLTQLTNLTLTAGIQTVTLADDDPEFRIAVGATVRYFVVPELMPNAMSQTPNSFQITHVTEASSTAEDGDNDIELELEFTPNTVSGNTQSVPVALSRFAIE